MIPERNENLQQEEIIAETDEEEEPEDVVSRESLKRTLVESSVVINAVRRSTRAKYLPSKGPGETKTAVTKEELDEIYEKLGKSFNLSNYFTLNH